MRPLITVFVLVPVLAVAARPSGHVLAQNTSPSGDAPSVFDRRALTEAFLRTSPELALVDARLEVRAAAVSAARSMPAPELEIAAWNVPFDRPYALDDAMMWMASIRQRFEPRGLRSERRRAALEERNGEEAVRVDTMLRVAEEAAMLHAELAVRTAERDETLAEKQALEALMRAVRTTLPSSSGSVRDVLGVEAELAVVENDLAEAEARRVATVRRINARLGRAIDTPIDVLVEPELIDPEALRRTIGRHPALRVDAASRAAARSRLRMAEIEARRPRMTAGIGVYEQPPVMSGMDRSVGYGLSFGLELPWIGGRAAGAMRTARAELAVADAEVDSNLLRVRVELETALGELDTATASLASYDARTIAALERLVEANLRGLPSGTTRIADVLAARRALARARVDRASLLGERLRAEAALQALAASLSLEDRGMP